MEENTVSQRVSLPGQPGNTTPAALLERLKKRYPEGHPREKNTASLLLRNRDLPILQTAGILKDMLGITLRQWLEQNGLLEMTAAPKEAIQPEAAAEETVSEPEQREQEPVPEPEPVSASEPERIPESESKPAPAPVAEPEPEPEPIRALTPEELHAAVLCDVQSYERMLRAKDQPYGIDKAYIFLRGLRRRDADRWLRYADGMSYDEYLLRNGLLPQRDILWWQSEFEKKSGSSLSGGMCTVRVPVYDGAAEVSEEKLRTRILEKPELRAVYREECHMLDVQVISAGEILGSLNRTLFRSNGIGTALAPLLMLQPDCVRNPRLAEDGRVEFELRLRKTSAAGKER